MPHTPKKEMSYLVSNHFQEAAELDAADAERRGKLKEAWTPEDFFAASEQANLFGIANMYDGKTVGFAHHENHRGIFVVRKFVAFHDHPAIKREMFEAIKNKMSAARRTDTLFVIPDSDANDIVDLEKMGLMHIDYLPEFFAKGEAARVLRYNIGENYNSPINLPITSFFERNEHAVAINLGGDPKAYQMTQRTTLRVREQLNNITGMEWRIYYSNDRGKMVPMRHPENLDKAMRICYMTAPIVNADRFNNELRHQILKPEDDIGNWQPREYGGVVRGIITADELQRVDLKKIASRAPAILKVMQPLSIADEDPGQRRRR